MHCRTLRRFAIASVLLVGLASAAIGQESSDFGRKVTAFVKEHCIDCHGPDVHKANLRLDTLGTDLTDDASFAKWAKVHDKVAEGKMPPKKSEQPPRAETDDFTKALRRKLHDASLDRQQTKGRVLLRRLNSTEYETTIRELVGTKVRVKEMLPDENAVAGFDNVASGLDFSATHMLLYQEAAEKAVLSAVPANPPYPTKARLTGKEMSERGSNFRQTLNRSCKLDGDSLTVYSKLPRYGLVQTGAVAGAGTYRVRMSVAGVGADKKPVPLGLLILESGGRDEPVVFDVKDIPVGESRVVELDVELGKRQAFVVNLLTHVDIRDTKKPIEEYTGPGFRIDWLEIEGPVGAFPPASYAKLFNDLPLKARSVAKAEREGAKKAPSVSSRKIPDHWNNDPLEPASSDPKADADRLLRAFLPKAFRGSVPESVVKLYVDRVQTKIEEKQSFFDAMMYAYKSILSSPRFLVFAEPDGVTESVDGKLRSPKLDDYAIANRLAYFLWSGPPDDALLAAAGRGELTKPANLRKEVDRLLDDPKAHRFTENFTGQWLDLRKINATVPDPRVYGEYDELLLWAMPRESRLVFEEILKHDRSLLEFVDADWSMLNARLAALYGIPGVEGNDLRKVTLPAGSHRGGVLTQAAVLKVTADGTRTSPVLRGKWVLEKILGQPPAPPPPDVPAIEPDIRGATTIRQQLEKHRAIATCASCHVHIDPPGFALEAFDPIGGYRDFYRATTGDRKKIIKVAGGRALFRGPDVETGAATADGKSFKGIDDYKKLLVADHKEQIARNMTEMLLTYATGADIQFADREVVDRILEKLKTRNYAFRTLVHDVVESRIFLNK
jgi:mono/diheme cytochrome c family protein